MRMPLSSLANQVLVPSTDILELRQYTLRPGQRDVLIELFDREFIETQEAVGMTVVGQFRDADNADRFVWLRGFADMDSRAAGLTAFYGGPTWRAHRHRANATMIDSDNVLLLEPASPATSIIAGPRSTAEQARPERLVIAMLYYPRSVRDFAEFYARSIRPIVRQAGGTILGEYRTASHANNFPQLPVREREQVYVVFYGFPSGEAYQQHRTSFTQHPRWLDLGPALREHLSRAETLRLTPTSRSRL